MLASLNSLAKTGINRAVAPLGIKITRRDGHDWTQTSNFIPLEQTLAAAGCAGLSVGDYIDAVMNNIPGATQATIDGMVRLGVFAKPIRTIVEIGPGSGRYLEKTIAACTPERYEIYETAKPWADYLASHYDVVLQPTDGRTLRATADASTDLVQAHKVFSTIPFLPSCCYWAEMVRITRPGGFVAFDIMTEACLDPATLDRWIGSGVENGSYPAAMPRKVAVDYFEARSFDLVGTFLVPMGCGHTELFVFHKR